MQVANQATDSLLPERLEGRDRLDPPMCAARCRMMQAHNRMGSQKSGGWAWLVIAHELRPGVHSTTIAT